MLTALLSAVVSWLLALFFAIVLGAHVFQATVLFPVWSSDPPKSLVEWLATPYPMRVPAFFVRLVSSLYTVSSIAVLLAALRAVTPRLALAVAGICGLVHLSVNLLIFLPTNRRLGLDPGGPGAANLDPQLVKTLVRKWGAWNLVRLAVETVGFVAAVLAVKAS